MSQKSTTAVVVAIAVALTMARGAGAAEAGERGWRVKLLGAWVNPSLDATVINQEGDPILFKGADAFGYGFGVEYRASERVSWSLDILRAATEVSLEAELAPDLSVRAQDSMQVTPLLVGMEFHLTPGRPIDVSVGPVVGWVRFGDVTFTTDVDDSLRILTDNKPAAGLRLGAETVLGSGPWSLSADLTYLKVDVEARNAEDFSFETREFSYDPVIITVGVGYRF